MVAGPTRHILMVWSRVWIVPLSMCSDILCSADLYVSLHTKKYYQGYSNSDRSPLDLHQVYHDIQNTESFWWWNTQPYFSHANLYSFIICFLPRWNSLIHTVSPRIDIVDLTDGIFNPVYWVSLDQKTTRLSLILFKVYSILEATYALNPSEAILIILG